MTDAPATLTWVRAAPKDDPGPGPWIEVAFGADDLVYLRETSAPENVVTTTRAKWERSQRASGQASSTTSPSSDTQQARPRHPATG